MPRPLPPWLRRLTATDPPGTLLELVLEQLRGVILDGAAPPGSPLPVDDIADRFAISRIPVREALRTLVGEGLVDYRPRAGWTVARLTRDELRQLYVGREALEAAALAASVRFAGPEDDVEARAAHAALGSSIASGDAQGHHRDSRRFHLALARPSRMPRLVRMVESAWNVTEPVRPMSHASPEQTAALHGEHEAMLAAFLARDEGTLLAISASHHERLRAMVATLPEEAGFLQR
jgi:DNA-binding GntR family transcriptional regulator